MGAPITWRSIIGPSLADASRPLDSATRTFNGAFDKLQGVISDREALDAANWQTTKANNTQAFLDEVAKFRTPEELAAAQASGALQNVRAGFGNQIDAAAVRGAEEQRITALRDQVMKGNQYADQVREREQRPIVESIMMSLYQGKPQDAANALVANPHLAGRADIQKKIADYQQVLTERGRADTRFKWDEQAQQWKVADEAQKEKLRPLEIESKQAGIASSRASTAASQAATKASTFRLEQDQKTVAAAEQATTMRAALTDNVYLDGTYRDSNAPELMELMTKNGIGDDNKERNAIIDRVAKLKEYTLTRTNEKGVKETVKVPLPLGVVKAALLSSHDQWINSKDEGWANTFEKRLQSMLKDNDLSQERTARDYLQYSELLTQQAKVPQAGGSKRR